MGKHIFIALPLIILLVGCQSSAGPDALGAGAGFSREAFVSSNDPASVGREHFARGDYALAERHFRRAVELNSSDASSWLGLAASYDRLERFDLADRAYETATQHAGNTFEVLNNRGFSYLLRGDSKLATQMFRRARSLRPNDPVVSNNLLLLQQAQTGS